MRADDPTKPIGIAATPDPVATAHRFIDVAADEYSRLDEAGQKAVRSMLRATFVRVMSELFVEAARR